MAGADSLLSPALCVDPRMQSNSENDKVQNRKQYVPCLMYGKRANGAAMIVQIVSHVDIARHGPYN
jgi:hypothetical protein